MQTAATTIDLALSRLKNFSARSIAPTAIKVRVDGEENTFEIDPDTGNIKATPADYVSFLGSNFKRIKVFFKSKGYSVEEVMPAAALPVSA